MSSPRERDTLTQSKRAALERRRRAYKNQAPEHYCAGCGHIVYEDDPSCLECDGSRPSTGWSRLKDQVDPWLGRVLDHRYMIVKELGQGSSASVYKAESMSISRRFAIKLIATGRGRLAEQIVGRLNREVEALGRLRNPHIVSFFEVLEIGDRFVAAVMDLVEGETLERLVGDGGPLSIQRACGLARQIANGLYEAHQAGLIHRDLKPENLIVERLPVGDDFVHILDFGIVRMSDEDDVEMTHGFIGTPLYASPEQAVGSSVNHRSDIYSLGAILFFMLTGRPPFVSTSVYEVLKMHARDPAPRLGQARPNVLFPEALEGLVASMLAKTPELRPLDLSAVIEELDVIVSMGYSDAQLNVSTTQSDPAMSPHETQPRERRRSIGAHEDSAGTFQGFGHRDPVQTPPFTRPLTGDRGQRALDIRPLPGRISYGVSLEEAPAAKPAAPPRVTAACGSQGLFAFACEGQAMARVLMSSSATPRELSLPVESPVQALGLSRHHLLTGHADGTIGLVSLGSAKSEVLFVETHKDGISAVCLDPAQRCMLAGSESGRIYVKDLRRDWQRLKTTRPIVRMAISLSADTLAVAHDDASLAVLHLANVSTPVASFSTPSTVKALSISSDNHLLAAALDDDSIVVYHILTGRPVMTVASKGRTVYALDFSQGNIPRALCEVEGELTAMTLEQIAHR
jgi:eukaryotic-like serine/threonine-protein kinase